VKAETSAAAEISAQVCTHKEYTGSVHAQIRKQVFEAQLSDTVRQLMTMLRADPQASATVVFVRLSDEMAVAENRIAVERKRYKDAVAAYNRTARGFPTFLLRPMLGFPRQDVYFHVSDEAKQAQTSDSARCRAGARLLVASDAAAVCTDVYHDRRLKPTGGSRTDAGWLSGATEGQL
jgi:hypothetical protein